MKTISFTILANLWFIGFAQVSPPCGLSYFKLITYWEDMYAVKNFTGPNFQVAVSHDADEKYLLDFPGTVSHYQVFAE